MVATSTGSTAYAMSAGALSFVIFSNLKAKATTHPEHQAITHMHVRPQGNARERGAERGEERERGWG